MRELIQRLINTTLTKEQLFYHPVSTVDEFERYGMNEGLDVDPSICSELVPALHLHSAKGDQTGGRNIHIGLNLC